MSCKVNPEENKHINDIYVTEKADNIF